MEALSANDFVATREKRGHPSLERAIHGQPQTVAVDELFDRYGDDVLLYLRHLLGNDEDAADVRQDVFALAHRSAARTGPLDHPRAWLFRIAHNRAVDHLRRRRVMAIFVRFEQVREEPGPHEDRSAAIDAWTAIDRLPLSWRESVVLRYRWDLTTAEIAAIQRRSEGAVRAELSRALRRLQRELGETAQR